jgi:GNAT superfamily N-acetyltransferase
MQILNSTLPAGDLALPGLIDRIRAERGTARQTPALPFSPLPGTANAGLLAGDAGAPGGYGWIRRQTGKRALLEIDAFPPELAGAFPVLLEACRRQAVEWECARLVAFVAEADEALAGEYRTAGFTPAGTVCELHGDFPGEIPDPNAPDGYFLKPYHELRHLPTLAALLHRAYHDRFGRPEFETDGVTVETVQAEIDADPDAGLERDYFTMLNFFGKGVAVVRCRGLAWIDAPGVVPEERGNGLHLPLLAAALNHLKAKGSRAIWLVSCDDDPAWIADYRRAGFTMETTRTCWQKKIA